MDNILDIVLSWSKTIRATEKQEKEAFRRLEICKSCEYIKPSPFEVCGECGCPIKAKVFSQKGCPKNKW